MQYEPGQIVPQSGTYACTRCGEFSTNVAGHRFPPSHHPGAKWRLVYATPHGSR